MADERAPDEVAPTLDAAALETPALDGPTLDAHAETLAAPPTPSPSPSRSTPRRFPSEDALVNGEVTIGEALAYQSFEERYAAGELIGRGGMGEVRQFHDNLIGRDVAVKVVRQRDDDDDDSVAGRMVRFLREARVQGQLEHPSIVPVYDMGLGGDGGTYFSMKRVQGTTLHAILHGIHQGDAELQERWSSRKLLNAVARVCLSVDFAHERGIVHRDLKPENIMLGDFGEVYVLDWGLAKVLEGVGRATLPADPRPSTSGATRAGAMMGTPGYMAPEQARGSELIDARADVYALGAVLFEVLAGVPLIEGSNLAERIANTLMGTDRSPAARAPDAEIPPELDRLCVQATAIDPSDRLGSARAISDAIEAFLDGTRDEDLRRRLAADHIDAARERAREALGEAGSLEARKAALGHVGRALALDPDDPLALSTLVELLTTPPAQHPPETDRRFAEMAQEKLRKAAGLGRYAMLSWLLPVPFALAVGVRDWPVAIANAVCLALTLGLVHLVYRSKRVVGMPLQLSVVVAGALTLALASRFMGPMMLVPTAFVAFSLSLAMTEDVRRRWLFVAIQGVAFLGPAALEWLGVIPPSYVFRDGALVVLPRLIELPEVGTWALLTVAAAGSIVAPAAYAGQLRDELTHAERTMLTQAWQLEQLLPTKEA